MEEMKCGTCDYHKYEAETDDWYCDNNRSEYYMDFTTYGDSCEDLEERDDRPMLQRDW